jgi:hypothetical protein
VVGDGFCGKPGKAIGASRTTRKTQSGGWRAESREHARDVDAFATDLSGFRFCTLGFSGRPRGEFQRPFPKQISGERVERKWHFISEKSPQAGIKRHEKGRNFYPKTARERKASG